MPSGGDGQRTCCPRPPVRLWCFAHVDRVDACRTAAELKNNVVVRPDFVDQPRGVHKDVFASAGRRDKSKAGRLVEKFYYSFCIVYMFVPGSPEHLYREDVLYFFFLLKTLNVESLDVVFFSCW